MDTVTWVTLPRLGVIGSSEAISLQRKKLKKKSWNAVTAYLDNNEEKLVFADIRVFHLLSTLNIRQLISHQKTRITYVAILKYLVCSVISDHAHVSVQCRYECCTTLLRVHSLIYERQGGQNIRYLDLLRATFSQIESTDRLVSVQSIDVTYHSFV